jgi:hypothetical protein
MAFGAGWFNTVPNIIWILVYIAATLIGIYYLAKAKGAPLLLWAFGLFIASTVLNTMALLGTIDVATTSIVSGVFIIIAFTLVGRHSLHCCV